MSQFMSTDPVVIQAVRQMKIDQAAAITAINAFRDDIGALDAVGVFTGLGVTVIGFAFERGTDPGPNWTVPDSDGYRRPKKTTPAGRELHAQMRALDAVSVVPGVLGSVSVVDADGRTYYAVPVIWEHDGVAWFDAGEKTIHRDRDIPDPDLWSPVRRSQLLAAVEAYQDAQALVATAT